MVSRRSVDEQLKRVHFKRGWNRPETDELANILLANEEIFECVNGWYEGGFALLVSTNIRVLLVDKKPFKYLTVEDVRFDTINQIDYSHRAFQANICITAGLKNLIFKSANQPRLRKLIGHVQHRMAEMKRIEEEERNRNDNRIDEMDQRLKAYLLSQYEQHQSLSNQNVVNTSAVDIDDEASDSEDKYYYASSVPEGATEAELYEDGIKELFHGRYKMLAQNDHVKTVGLSDSPQIINSGIGDVYGDIDINPLEIACSKFPIIFQHRKLVIA